MAWVILTWKTKCQNFHRVSRALEWPACVYSKYWHNLCNEFHCCLLFNYE